MPEALGGAYFERSENVPFYSSGLTRQISSAAHEGDSGVLLIPRNSVVEIILTQKTEARI